MTTASPLHVSEPARERETFKYDDLGISTAALRNPTPRPPYKPIPNSILSSTPDPCLTAFAQLGLYRLDASHAIISLFDRTYQHFVAEAVRCDGASGKKKTQVIYCGTAIPRADSLCEHVLTGPAEEAAIPGTTYGDSPADLPVSVIPDLDRDARFCHVMDANRKFYAGVPIRSPTGVNIGVYCVLDGRPRPEGLAEEQVQFVRDISRTVMCYLEAKRSSEWYRRGERMVRGLGSFVEGQGTLWSEGGKGGVFRDIPGMEGGLNKKLQAGEREEGVDGMEKGGVIKVDTAVGVGKGARVEREEAKMASARHLQTEVERVFSKAANIIREAVEVEGVVFLDASVRSFGGLIGKEVSEPPILTSFPTGDSSSDGESGSCQQNTAEYQTCRSLGFSTSVDSSINGDKMSRAHAPVPERLLQRLLQRYHHGHIFNFETDGSVVDHPSPDLDDMSPISPWAKRTYFPADGEKVKPCATPQRVRKRRDIASTLQKMFPGAKSVAFVPIFDGQKNRWFAGGFVWTKMPTRIFTVENELSYLRVFALTTMAEIARLHTKAADKAKTDILGSISHELRSPLHGVVGAVDLLRNTELDSAQENILRTIETSGRTLLDTIDHLLDYSRISNQIRAKVERRGSVVARDPSSISPVSLASNAPELTVHLDRLAEEVVESVLAGWSYRNRSDAHFAAWSTLVQGSSDHVSSISAKRRQMQGHVPKPSQPVQVLLDIEPTAWSFKTHPGAFRRIVMNLLGNSLKFTNTGFIRISLRQEHDASQDKNGLTTITLAVSDSGKGISEDYLANQLFTPFSQEDPFAPGTGLGLSLVRQMANTLGGFIDVASRSGQGTNVLVSLPLLRSEGMDEEEADFRRNVDALAGKKVLLQGFDQTVRVRGGFKRADRSQKSQQRLVEEICRDWLHMKVIWETKQTGPGPDFVIYNQKLTTDTRLTAMTSLAYCPHVFIRQDPTVGSHVSAKCCTRERFCSVAQPIGPRKLADALVAARRRFQENTFVGLDGVDSSPHSAESVASPPLLPPNGELLSPMIMDEPVHGSFPISTIDGPSPLLQPHIEQMNKEGSYNTGLASPLMPKSILIVDDNPINIKILTAYMLKLNHPHATALNGLEAVNMYTKSPGDFNCILTDISMPVMDGLESTRRIREFERTNKLDPVKVITLTGLSGADIQQDAFVSGVDLFLTRPLALKGLVKALESTGVIPSQNEDSA
ncbi:hypothetical protein OQA88_9724 [Cercophora sp. LCS_1]